MATKIDSDPFRRHFESMMLIDGDIDRLETNYCGGGGGTTEIISSCPVLGSLTKIDPSIIGGGGDHQNQKSIGGGDHQNQKSIGGGDQNQKSMPPETVVENYLRPNLRDAFLEKNSEKKGREIELEFERKLLSILIDYKDLLYSDFSSTTSRTRSDQIQFAYTLHALNHVLKSRKRISKNNLKLRSSSSMINKIDESAESSISLGRDQGLTRPKVLILLPFRYMASNVVRTIIRLLYGPDEDFADPDSDSDSDSDMVDKEEKSKKNVKKKGKTGKKTKKGMVVNKKRFFNEFANDEDEEANNASTNGARKRSEVEEAPMMTSNKRPRLERPSDYEETFRPGDGANTDDCFRLGLSIGGGGGAKTRLKLYSDFYQSDLILASPLGLRMALGAEGERRGGYDYDFLSSIEILIFDRADVFLMQNWSHVLHIMDHMNRQPLQPHGVDFSRVRMFNLNGWSKYYRQTLLFSPILTAELRSIFNGYCRNFEGRYYVSSSSAGGGGGILNRILVDGLPHAFQRFSCGGTGTGTGIGGITEEPEKRFEFFLTKILPQYSTTMEGTAIFIPSYYDFVRLRNYFKRNQEILSGGGSGSGGGCVHICEYTDEKKVSRARDLFFHGDKRVLLYTERFHFYHRYRIRGIRNLIFYQLPTYPHFYSEMCNAMLVADWTTTKGRGNGNGNSKGRQQQQLTCSVLYSEFDSLRLAGVLGNEKARELLRSEKSVHVMMVESSG